MRASLTKMCTPLPAQRLMMPAVSVDTSVSGVWGPPVSRTVGPICTAYVSPTMSITSG